ncbi:hypothetical protein MLD38_025286 [Melastoma candidum]|uniref:Uncharacterized protein n=1 Tax=Melastoma candidum TaxID=119954 RepID=A0ACB9NUV1_9MYRT|nr:hypothetical protein MLD38_025286 [Melastoma candidum]
MDDDSQSFQFVFLLSSFRAMSILAFAAVFSVSAVLLYVLRLKAPCGCETCTAFLSTSWRKDFNNLCDWYAHLLRKSPHGTIQVHVLRNVVTADERNVEHVLRTRFENYPKGKAFSTILGDLLGGGIFNVDGDAWMFQRKMASLELGSVSMRAHAFEVTASEIDDRLIPLLYSFSRRDGAVLDLQDVFRRFSFDTICKFSFGMDPGCLDMSLPVSEFVDAFDTASRLCAERAMAPTALLWKLKRAFNVGSERRLGEAVKRVNALAADVIKRKRETGSFRGLGAQNDLLTRFMFSVDDDKFLKDIVVSFLLAGRDTVASALTSFFWLLSQHPEVRAAILEEFERVIRSTTGEGELIATTATFDQLRKLHYLHAAVYECMRLYPPVQFDSKFALEDDVLPDGTFVGKGTRVTYHPYAMGRMERLWGPDCLEFRPERWLNVAGVFRPESPYKYPVFQGGPRVCLGKEMAIMEIKGVILAVVRQFEFKMVEGDGRSLRFDPGLTATVRGGLRVAVEEWSPPL